MSFSVTHLLLGSGPAFLTSSSEPAGSSSFSADWFGGVMMSSPASGAGRSAADSSGKFCFADVKGVSNFSVNQQPSK